MENQYRGPRLSNETQANYTLRRAKAAVWEAAYAAAKAEQAEIVSELAGLLKKATAYTFRNPVLDNKIEQAIAKATGI